MSWRGTAGPWPWGSCRLAICLRRSSWASSSADRSLAVDDRVGERRRSTARFDMGWGSLLGMGSCGGVCPTGEGVA
jgi:hypothetical protein